MKITYCPKCGAKLYSNTAGYYCTNLICLLHIRPNGELDVDELVSRIKKDIGAHSYNVSLAVTHLNEFENKELLGLKELNVKYLSYKETRELVEKNLEST